MRSPLRKLCRGVGCRIHPVPVRGSADLDRALTAAAEARIDGLYVVSSRHTALNIGRIVDFATKNRLPLVGGWGEWVQLGGLLSYGPNTADMVRQSATYVDRVLKGARTSDLPVQQPTRFELHINVETAKALVCDS